MPCYNNSKSRLLTGDFGLNLDGLQRPG